MKNTSIWLDGLVFPPSNPLKKEINVDVLIIGGGITGISTAYHLSSSSLKIALVDANRIGCGVTSRTTGKLTYLQEKIYSKIEKSRGIDASRLYYQSQKEAISLVCDIVKKEKIDCDFTRVDSIVFTRDKNKLDEILQEKKLLESFGAQLSEIKNLPNQENCQYGFFASDTYVFHPLKYLMGLKKVLLKRKVSIYEQTRIQSMKYQDNFYFCYTKDAFIKARQVVLASHYPYFLKPFFMPGRVTLEKSYIGSFRVDQDLSFSAISIDKPVQSIRYQSDDKKGSFQILLYGSHNICTKYNEKENFQKLEKFSDHFDYLWSNIDIITSDSLPFIGKIQKGLFLGTGYNTWGMTNGSLAGKILSEQLLKKKSPYDDLFVPKRGLSLAQLLDYPIVIGSNLKSYAGNMILKKKPWYHGRVQFDKRENQDVAIYTDDKGIEHIVYLKCPHLYCNLNFNEEEMTWDCPCHGSRFDLDGHCIEGPSNDDICYPKEK